MNLKIEFKMHTPNLGPYFKKKSNKLMAKVTPIIIMENLLENFNKMQVIQMELICFNSKHKEKKVHKNQFLFFKISQLLKMQNHQMRIQALISTPKAFMPTLKNPQNLFKIK